MRVLCYAQTNIGSGRDNNEDNYYCNGTFKRDAAVPVAEAAAEPGGQAADLRRVRRHGRRGKRRAGGALVRADTAPMQQR